MRTQNEGMFREAGTVLAVLAIYVLTLLAPLHQSADLQRDLGKLGYQTTAQWLLCAAFDQDREPDSPVAVKCPATGVGKKDLALPPPVLHVHAVTMTEEVAYGAPLDRFHNAWHDYPTQPRAPPATI